MSETNKPIDTIRDGRLKASIWKNEGENGPYLSVTFAKTYTDKNDQPRDSQSFSDTDLLKVAEIAREAYSVSRDLRFDLKTEYAQSREAQSRDNQADAPEQAQPRERSRSRSYSR